MNFINEYPNFLSEETCKIILSTLGPAEWFAPRPEATLKGYFTEYGLATYDDKANEEINKVLDMIDKKVEEYFEPVKGLVPYSFSRDGFSILKTKSSGIPLHYDSEVMNNQNFDCRCFLVLVYLTGDHRGGELIFPYQKVSITPAMGKLAIFPSSFAYPHLVTPFMDGERMCVRVNYIINKESIRVVGKRSLIDHD